MSTNTYTAFDTDNPDRVYGEIYEYEGIYWAETILIQDGLDWVLEKSRDFSSRQKASAWLAERGVSEQQSTLDALTAYVTPEALKGYWNKAAGFFGVRHAHHHAKAFR